MDEVSPSMLGTWYKCAEQFRRRYIEGEIIPPGIAARRGSATHKAAETNHKQKVNSGVDLPLEQLLDVASDHYRWLIKEQGVFIPKELLAEKVQLLGAGLDETVALTKVYRQEAAPLIKPIAAEERLRADFGFPALLSGKPDVIAALDDDGLWLPDFKTASKSYSQADADNSLQITWYYGLFLRHYKRPPDKLSIEALISLKEPKHQSVVTWRGPGHFAVLLDRLEIFFRQLEVGVFPPCDPGYWACNPKWCGYWWTCKYAHRN